MPHVQSARARACMRVYARVCACVRVCVRVCVKGQWLGNLQFKNATLESYSFTTIKFLSWTVIDPQYPRTSFLPFPCDKGHAIHFRLQDDTRLPRFRQIPSFASVQRARSGKRRRIAFDLREKTLLLAHSLLWVPKKGLRSATDCGFGRSRLQTAESDVPRLWPRFTLS